MRLPWTGVDDGEEGGMLWYAVVHSGLVLSSSFFLCTMCHILFCFRQVGVGVFCSFLFRIVGREMGCSSLR